MKGSEYRRRYVLLYSGRMYNVLPNLERELFRTFRSKRRFATDEYAIFLTNQYHKDQFIEYVRKRFPTVEPVITSGTIKKCKSVMQSHMANRKNAEKEISALPQDADLLVR